MTEQQNQLTNDFNVGEYFSENGLDAELSSEREKDLQILNLTTECRHWKKKFEGSKAKVAALKNENMKIMEGRGVLNGKISSAFQLVRGYLNDFPLTSKTEERFKNVLRVLEADSHEFTSKGPSAQHKLTPGVTYALSSVETRSSLGVDNTVAQNDLNIPVTRIKRRQVCVGSEVPEKKVRGKERPGPGSSTFKITQQTPTRKHTNKSSVTKAPSKTRQRGPGNVPPQIQIAHAPLTPTSGLQSTTNSPNMENFKSPSAEEKGSCAPRDTISIGTNSQTPKPAQSGTSRLVKNANEEFNEDSITLTSIEMAVESFFKSLSKNKNLDNDTKAMIEKLCLRLKCDPVAVKLAVSYVNELLVHADALKDVIENYIVKIDNDIVRGGRKVPGFVPSYLAWRVTCEKIKETPEIGEHALKVTEIISFLAADNIPTQFVLDLYDSMENEENFTTRENIFQLLKRYAVINSGPGELISVHPLIQEANRTDLEHQEKFTEVLGRIQSGAHKMMKKNYVTSQEMIHVRFIWDHVKERADLIKEGDGFPISICEGLKQLRKYSEMYDFSCLAQSTFESTLGEDHRSSLKSRYCKGVALNYMGEFSKAVGVLTELYEKQKELFGEGDVACFVTAIQIGMVHLQLERHDEALKWFRNALEIRERIFGVGHPTTFTLKSSMALLLKKQGKDKEAMKLYQQVLEGEERVNGKEHPSTLAAKFSVARHTHSQGKYEDALEMFQEILEAREKALVVDHPEILKTKEGIANTYRRLRRNAEAFELYKEVLEKREEILGPEHPLTLDTKFNMATVRYFQGKYKDALKLFQEDLKVRERVLEINHPNTLDTKDRIAATYYRLGRDQEAVELFKEVLEKREAILGPEHPQTFNTKFDMATVRFFQGNYKDALKLFQEVLKVRERVLEINHPDTLDTKDRIAATYYRLGRDQEAVELFKEVLEKREAILGPENLQTLETKLSLAVVRFRQKKYKDALKLFQEVLEVDHPDTWNTKKWIADTYKCLGRN